MSTLRQRGRRLHHQGRAVRGPIRETLYGHGFNTARPFRSSMRGPRKGPHPWEDLPTDGPLKQLCRPPVGHPNLPSFRCHVDRRQLNAGTPPVRNTGPPRRPSSSRGNSRAVAAPHRVQAAGKSRCRGHDMPAHIRRQAGDVFIEHRGERCASRSAAGTPGRPLCRKVALPDPHVGNIAAVRRTMTAHGVIRRGCRGPAAAGSQSDRAPRVRRRYRLRSRRRN